MYGKVIIPFFNNYGSYTTGDVVDLPDAKEAKQLAAAGIVKILDGKQDAIETAEAKHERAEQAVVRTTPRRKKA